MFNINSKIDSACGTLRDAGAAQILRFFFVKYSCDES